jgi:hypothetical protein
MVYVIIGNLLGVMIVAGMVWADFEGSLFIFGLDGKRRTRRLDCPVLMTQDDVREIKLTLKNPGEKNLSHYVVASISEGFLSLTRQEKENVSVGPGQRKTLTWEIYPEDAAYQRIVLFHVYLRRTYPYPSLDGTCGVLVLDIPGLKGSQVMGLALGLTFLLILGGNGILQLQYRNNLLGPQRQNISNAMFFMSILILLGMLIGSLGLWVLGLIILTSIIMMIVVLLFQIAL